ncbi:pickpocket protein 28-like [Nilaparvata lugens]|uniref:pickpocket protein 28-like n=1 Tax=Nilaparvata lugens TaxID=108931 RepID=UPI00193D60F1|nr:pickpocket protein 28-like [Nilaparvata lugens]
MNHLLEQITLPCDKIIGLCKWNSVETDCGEIFEKVITPEGHCCTFNYHIHTKQELEKSDMRTIWLRYHYWSKTDSVQQLLGCFQ